MTTNDVRSLHHRPFHILYETLRSRYSSRHAAFPTTNTKRCFHDDASLSEVDMSSLDVREQTKTEMAFLTGSDRKYERLVEELEDALQNRKQRDKHDVKAMLKVVMAYCNVGSLDLALEMLLRVLPLQQQQEDEEGSAKTMHAIGTLYTRATGKEVEAKRWLTASLEKKISCYSVSSPHPKNLFHYEVGKTLNVLATLHCRNIDDIQDSDAKEALDLFQRAELHYRNHSPEKMSNHVEVAVINENIAMLHRCTHHPDLALLNYKEALRIRRLLHSEQMNNDDDPAIAILYVHIGDCYFDMFMKDVNNAENENEAMNHYEEAMRLRQDILHSNTNNDDDGSVVVVVEEKGGEEVNKFSALDGLLYHNIGTMHAQKGRYELALECYEKSNDIKVALVGDTHPEVASTLNTIGAVYATMGEKHRSLVYFKRALFIYQLNNDTKVSPLIYSNVQKIEKTLQMERTSRNNNNNNTDTTETTFTPKEV